jgi:hypothetical protein
LHRTLFVHDLFAGYSEISQVAAIGDREQKAFGATYAVGGFTLGYQWSKDDNPAAAATADFYENQAYGISFSVNDNLSVSWAEHESEQNTSGNDTTLTGQSLQAAYTVGGASIKFAETSVDNRQYVNATKRDGRIIALTLAF